MKIVAALPFRNEAWVLPTWLSAVRPLADEIVALDDGSLDDSKDLLLAASAHVYDMASPLDRPIQMYKRRQFLLERGRELGGTHFIWLDADEAFTAPFIRDGRQRLKEMKPGQKLSMQWLILWKSSFDYRHDGSVWTNSFKDFVVCDQPDYRFAWAPTAVEGRTQGPNTPETLGQVAPQDGAVLHFQFARWNQCQTKQAYTRCWERIEDTMPPWSINERFSITLDSADARTRRVPEEWLAGLQLPEPEPQDAVTWQLARMREWFDLYGAAFFEPLQIWHLPALHDEFVRRVGREPRVAVRPWVGVRGASWFWRRLKARWSKPRTGRPA